MDQDRGWLAKWPRLGHAEHSGRAGSALGLALLAVTLAGCGATERNRGHESDGNGAATSQGAGGTGSGAGVAGGTGPTDGGSAPSDINLVGDPKYFRFVRLTGSQWAASVQEVLQLTKPSGLEQDFSPPFWASRTFRTTSSCSR